MPWRVPFPAPKPPALRPTDSTCKLLSGGQRAEPAEHLPEQQGLRTGILKNILYEQSSRRREVVIAYLMYTKCMSDMAISPLLVLSPQYPASLFFSFFFFSIFSLKQQIFLESLKQIIEQLVLAVFSLRVELQPSAWG